MADKFMFYDLLLIQYRANNLQSSPGRSNLPITPYEKVIQAIALNNTDTFGRALVEADLDYTSSIPCKWMSRPGEDSKRALTLIEVAAFYKSYHVIDFIVLNAPMYMLTEYSLGLLESHSEMSNISEFSDEMIASYIKSFSIVIHQLTDEELVIKLSQFNSQQVNEFCKVVFGQHFLSQNEGSNLAFKFSCAVIRSGHVESMSGLNQLDDIFFQDYISHYIKASLFFGKTFFRERVAKCLANLNTNELNVFSNAVIQLDRVNRQVGGITGTSSLSLVITELSLQATLCVIARVATLNHSLHKGNLVTNSMSGYVISAVNNIAELDDANITSGHLAFLDTVATLATKNLPQEAARPPLSIFKAASTPKADELRSDLLAISSASHELFIQLASTRLGASV
jgi:hypothetical protein